MQYTGSQYKGQLVTSGTYELNKWHHIVAVYDTEQATDSERMKLYVNGEQSLGTASYPSQNFESIGINKAGLSQRFGRMVKSNLNGADGYLSDVYFVDSEALEPEAFGKSFEGKWGPLDSAVVLENIKGKTKSPYQERPNMDEKWSDYAVSNGLEPWTKAFDGVISTSFNTNEATSNIDETPIVWTHTGTKPAFTKLEVWANRDYLSEPSSGKITINSFDVSDQIAGNTPAWYEIDLTGASNTTTLESITLAGYNTATSGQGNGVMRLGGVRLDGRILVDGPADNSQNWSDYSTAGDNPSKIFNGNITNISSNSLLTAANEVVLDGVSITGQTLSFVHSSVGNNSITVTFNDLSTTSLNLAGTGALKTDDYDLGSVKTITKIVIDGTTAFGLNGVKVDDKVLIDSGAQWDQSQVWSDGATAANGFVSPQIINSRQVGGAEYAFDGNLQTAAASANTATDGTGDMVAFTFSFANSLAITQSLRVYVGDNAASQNYVIECDGASNTEAISAGEFWIHCPALVGKSTNSTTPLVIKQSVNVHWYNLLHAIEIDGKILVDAGSHEGGNGFYMPLHPIRL